MNPNNADFLNSFKNKNIDLAKNAGYSPLIPEGLRDKYKREADIDKQNLKKHAETKEERNSVVYVIIYSRIRKKSVFKWKTQK